MKPKRNGAAPKRKTKEKEHDEAIARQYRSIPIHFNNSLLRQAYAKQFGTFKNGMIKPEP